MNKKEIGSRAERIAENYLKKYKYKIICKNFKSKFGEVDLICIDKNYLVFIEVKMRSNKRFGNVLYSVPKTKQDKIIKTAKFFLLRNRNKFDNFDIRFDTVMIENLNNCKVLLIKNAFSADI